MVPIKPQFVMQNTYTHTHLKWKHGNLVAPENPCKFQRFSCILQCTLCPTFMITTPEVHTSLLSLVPINTLFIIRDFGSGKYSNASMYVCVCVCVYVCVYKRLKIARFIGKTCVLTKLMIPTANSWFMYHSYSHCYQLFRIFEVWSHNKWKR